MRFIEKLGCFINRQATEWKMLHEAEKEHPNAPATFARAFARGIVHWAFASLVVVCYAVEGIYHGRWTAEVAAGDLFSTVWKLMAGFAICHLFFEFLGKRLTLARGLGYLGGFLLALGIFVWKLNEIQQFTTDSMLHYLTFLFAGWLWSKFVAYALGPMINVLNKKQGADRGKRKESD